MIPTKVGREDTLKVIWSRDKEMSGSVIVWQGSTGKTWGLPIPKSLPSKRRQCRGEVAVHANALPGNGELQSLRPSAATQKAADTRCNIHMNRHCRNSWTICLVLQLSNTLQVNSWADINYKSFPLFLISNRSSNLCQTNCRAFQQNRLSKALSSTGEV